MEEQLQYLNKQLEEHRGKATMQSLLADLQNKLEQEIENLKIAREQKQEIQNMLVKAQQAMKEA